MSHSTIQNQIFAVERYLMHKAGVDASQRAIAPLTWYIGTDRASLDFLRWFINTKPFVIGRILLKEGSYDDTINALKAKANI